MPKRNFEGGIDELCAFENLMFLPHSRGVNDCAVDIWICLLQRISNVISNVESLSFLRVFMCIPFLVCL